ncbi:Uncharacterised protein [Streptococcus dysgalactiae]|nr:Uncharacterised protein [Streptococcus dysgalactiae]
MNKRIKKKIKKLSYKIPKHIIRLTKRWTKIDTNIIHILSLGYLPEKNYKKRIINNTLRKYKRIDKFLSELEQDHLFRSDFRIFYIAYGDYQGDGKYCDQSSGWSGYDFHGRYYYPIGNGKYFGYYYEC